MADSITYTNPGYSYDSPVRHLDVDANGRRWITVHNSRAEEISAYLKEHLDYFSGGHMWTWPTIWHENGTSSLGERQAVLFSTDAPEKIMYLLEQGGFAQFNDFTMKERYYGEPEFVIRLWEKLLGNSGEAHSVFVFPDQESALNFQTQAQELPFVETLPYESRVWDDDTKQHPGDWQVLVNYEAAFPGWRYRQLQTLAEQCGGVSLKRHAEAQHGL